ELDGARRVVRALRPVGVEHLRAGVEQAVGDGDLLGRGGGGERHGTTLRPSGLPGPGPARGPRPAPTTGNYHDRTQPRGRRPTRGRLAPRRPASRPGRRPRPRPGVAPCRGSPPAPPSPRSRATSASRPRRSATP